MQEIKSFISNADMALANKQYETALKWYQDALEIDTDNIYCLSRCGAITAGLQRFNEAVDFMRRAYEAAPDKGDSAFNYGNSCLFKKDYTKAFEMFVEAEQLGCSEDVLPNLYLQMGLICSMRHDAESANVYLDKCAKADKTGLLMLNPDIISERLNIYTATGDYKRAAKTAAELVAAAPTVYAYYMLQFGIVISKQDYAAADKILNEAERYAKMTDEEKMNLLLQKASLYVVMADADPKMQSGKMEEAAALLIKGRDMSSDKQTRDLASVSLAEVYNRLERFDDAVAVLREVIGIETMDTIILPAQDEAAPQPQTEALPEDADIAPTDEDYAEIDQQLETDMQVLQDKIAEGVIDPYMEPVTYGVNEEGMEIPYFDDSAFGNLARPAIEDVPAEEETVQEPQEAEAAEENGSMEDAFHDRTLYALLTALLGKNDFASARRCGAVLMNCKTPGYAYYGRYAEAVSSFKLDGMTEETKMKYARAIAFFRNRTFANAKDTLAAVLRARLYAERGDYEKAEELSGLLAEQDRKTLLAYIEKCRADSGKE